MVRLRSARFAGRGSHFPTRAASPLVGSLGSLLLVITTACGSQPASNASAAERPEAQVVRLVPVTEVRLDKSVVVAGDLAAKEEAVLSMKVPGRLEMVAVDLGSRVAAGQPIARLQTTAYKLRVAQADATLRQARARLGLSADGDDDTVDPQKVGVVRETRAVLEEVELTLGRVRKFVERGISPRSDLDAAEAAFKVASSRYQDALEEVRGRQAVLSQRRTELELAREQLSAAVLEAPFAGQILARPAAPGQYVDAGTPIATLVRLDPLRLRVEVPERAAPSVKRGQSVRITVEGEPGNYSGVVVRLSPSISADNRTLLVEAEIPNDPARLRPGSFARAEIVVEPDRPTLMIPIDSVVSFAGVDKVFVVHDGKAVERRIRLGRREGTLVEVEEGLARGAAVIAQPGTMVAGRAVRIETK
jgi:RND family efflux transporter MFP subunit